MRFIHGLIKLVTTAALLAVLVIVAMYPISEIFEWITTNLPDNEQYKQIAAGIAGLGALLLFLPRLPKRRKENTITFDGTHGEVTIALQPVEETLERVIAKMPEVSTISIAIKPLDGPGRVRVSAAGILLKDANSDARLITARVNSYIKAHTRKILGLQDIDVRLKVNRWKVNMKTVKTEPLMLEAPEGETETVSQKVSPMQATAGAAVAGGAPATASAAHPAQTQAEPSAASSLAETESAPVSYSEPSGYTGQTVNEPEIRDDETEEETPEAPVTWGDEEESVSVESEDEEKEEQESRGW